MMLAVTVLTFQSPLPAVLSVCSTSGPSSRNKNTAVKSMQEFRKQLPTRPTTDALPEEKSDAVQREMHKRSRAQMSCESLCEIVNFISFWEELLERTLEEQICTQLQMQ